LIILIDLFEVNCKDTKKYRNKVVKIRYFNKFRSKNAIADSLSPKASTKHQDF
jgi:hypothetical protein